mmetsp:Transcript_64912/g.115510  ORF Transcript_64912/g.115510 Transcript_64912/m.115510 type:complete len:296 (-) Transcript_64912:518-1405(-)
MQSLGEFGLGLEHLSEHVSLQAPRSREHECHLLRGRPCGGGGCRGLGLGNDQMGVGPTEPEGAHVGHQAPSSLGLSDSDRERREDHGEPLQVEHGVQGLQVQIGGSLAILDGKNGFDHPCNPGGTLQMPDGALHGPQRKGLCPAGPENLLERGKLDGVAQGSACPVALHEADVQGSETGIVQRSRDYSLLGWAIWGCQRGGATVLVDGGSLQCSVPGTACLSRMLQHDGATTLTSHIAVCRLVKGLAPGIHTEHLGCACVDEIDGAEQHVHPPDHCRLTIAPVQRQSAHVCCHRG